MYLIFYIGNFIMAETEEIQYAYFIETAIMGYPEGIKLLVKGKQIHIKKKRPMGIPLCAKIRAILRKF